MMLFGAKFIAPIVAVLALLGFATGNLHWNSDHYRCFQKKHWSQGDWHTGFALGKLEFRYRDKNYDCDVDWKLDPSKYKKDASGNITPIDN